MRSRFYFFFSSSSVFFWFTALAPHEETTLGLVFKAHRLVYHSTLGWRAIKKKKKTTLDPDKEWSKRLQPPKLNFAPDTVNPSPQTRSGQFSTLNTEASGGRALQASDQHQLPRPILQASLRLQVRPNPITPKA